MPSFVLFLLFILFVLSPFAGHSNFVFLYFVFSSGFDQEAAAMLVARVSTFRIEHEETFDLLRWLDRSVYFIYQFLRQLE